MKYKYVNKVLSLSLLFIIVFSFFVYKLDKNNQIYSDTISGNVQLENLINVEYIEEDLNESYNYTNSTLISLNNNSISINGDGASVSENTVTIKSGGTYIIKGTLEDGQVIVNASKEDVVRLILEGVDMFCSYSSPIYSIQSKKTIITLAEKTINTLSDVTSYIYETSLDNEPDATIFVKDDLTINGLGTLKVYGNYNDAIVCKDNLIITNGNIIVTSVNNGICGKDSITIKNGIFDINSKKDGLKSNNSTDISKGWIYIDNGNFNIISDNDGIQAETNLQINNGKFDITTGNGSSANISIKSNKLPNMMTKEHASVNNETEEDTSTSIKGIKAGSNISIYDGDFIINSYEDSIHSNDTIVINGGNLKISSGDDAIHADLNLLIDNDATINISTCYEGLESESIVINNGTIYVNSSDDGINASSSTQAQSDFMPQQSFERQQTDFNSRNSNLNSNCSIKINGGYIFIESSGDGLDSNGDLYITNGIVFINGAVSGGDSSLDYDRNLYITGGLLLSAGGSGMMQLSSNNSSQNILSLTYSETQKANTTVNISKSSGESIVTFTPSKDYQLLIISSSQLENNETYTISSSGYCKGEITNDIYIGGTYYNGTKLTDVTISNNITSISDKGEAIESRNTINRNKELFSRNPNIERPIN